MKYAAYGMILSVGTITLADLLKTPIALQLGALSLLAWIIWYLLVRAFPQHVKAQKEEREAFLAFQEEQRAAFLDSQEEARRDFTESLGKLVHTLDLMTAAISGRQKRD